MQFKINDLRYILDPKLSGSEHHHLLNLMQSWRFTSVQQVYDIWDANCILCLHDPKLSSMRLNLRKQGHLMIEWFRSNKDFKDALLNINPRAPYKASRFCNEDHIEVTTKGDARFSPFFMKLSDGQSIENKYQLDIKGYRELGANSWKDVKGLPPINDHIDVDKEYTKLILQYFTENPCMLYELAVLGTFNTFTDLHWVEPYGSQAATYRDILNQIFNLT